LEGRRLLSVSVGSLVVAPLAANPPPRVVARGEKVRLTVQGVAASPDDGVRSVTYFVDVDRDGSLGPGDALIGRARNAANDFSVSRFIRWAWSAGGGTLTVSAVAQGVHGASDFGPALTQDLPVPPGAVTTGNAARSSTHTLTARRLRQLGRELAPTIGASQLAGQAFQQLATSLSGPTLPGNAADVLGGSTGSTGTGSGSAGTTGATGTTTAGSPGDASPIAPVGS
jgi:hypothetical protein